jgi:hypothetical protein
MMSRNGELGTTHAAKKYYVSIVSMSSFPTEETYVRFEVFTAVTMKNAIFWDVMPCGSCKN